MRRIVATVAFGAPEYLECAEVMFRSLRLAGWEGECVCVSDREHPFEPELRVETVLVAREQSAKAAAAAKLVQDPSDVVMLVDSDILFLFDPMPLLEKCARGRKVMCATTGYPLKRFAFSRRHLTRDEINRMDDKRPCLNTGLMVFPGELAASFCGAWAGYHAEVRGELEDDYNVLGDQPALEALVYRGKLEVERLPWELMFFPSTSTMEPPAGTGVLHFTGFPHTESGKRALLDCMRDSLRRLEAGILAGRAA